MREKIIEFVTNDLCENNKWNNATTYYVSEREIEVVFERNHRELYNRILQFCIENNITVKSTQPATLATVLFV